MYDNNFSGRTIVETVGILSKYTFLKIFGNRLENNKSSVHINLDNENNNFGKFLNFKMYFFVILTFYLFFNYLHNDFL